MDIARIRRFNRAVTSELGALDQDFLGRGRPLGQARVLNAIGLGHSEVRDLRHFLGLDSGLMSRLLRSLEADGLIETRPSDKDARQREVTLTPKGQDELAAYEALSDKRAAEMIGAHKHPEILLQAIDVIAGALSRAPVILRPEPAGSDAAHYAMQRYAQELSDRFGHSFDVPRLSPEEAAGMAAPVGQFVLATCDGVPVGCGALRPLEPVAQTGEIKRVWVCPSTRGQGLGRRIMHALESEARNLGYRTLRLDTNSRLPEAIALYHRLGWDETERYNDDPNPDRFFEKAL